VGSDWHRSRHYHPQPGVGAIILIAWAIVLAFIGIGLTGQRDID